MTEQQQDPDAAMADKHRAACEEARRRDLSDFIDWLRERYVFATMNDNEFNYLDQVNISNEQLFTAYFEIDLDAVERYRQRLIEDLQEKANPAP